MSDRDSPKDIEDRNDYVNPLINMDLSNSPVDWQKGDYPAIDDIWSWLHLSKIHEILFNNSNTYPIVPEIVFIFRLARFTDICYKRQFLRSYGFFKHYGTVDLKIVTQELWLEYLTLVAENDGFQTLLTVFPSTVKPITTKTHVNPRIKNLIDFLRPKDTEPTILFKKQMDTKTTKIVEPSINENSEKFTPNGTLIESSKQIFDESFKKNQINANETHHESIPSQSTTKDFSENRKRENSRSIDFTYEEISRAILPSDSDEEFMGSGVSCGLLGEGGMAKVYKVRVEDLEMFRAGKVLIPNKVCQDREQVMSLISRYRDEAKLTAQLHHSNIVVVHLFSKFRGLPYIEMEIVSGADLKKLILRKGKMPIELVNAISILCLRGLAYAHSQTVMLNGIEHPGVMHRDIKPANILLDSKKANIKLTDFGIARPPSISYHTMPNNVVGTLGYMAPEQLESSEVDTRTDIYSFGATMYEMLTGNPLFPQENFVEMLKARQTNSYTPISTYRKDIHKDLSHIIDSCLKVNINERIQSANSLMDYLEDYHHKVSKERPEAILQDYVLSKKYFESSSNMIANNKRSFLGNFLKK